MMNGSEPNDATQKLTEAVAANTAITQTAANATENAAVATESAANTITEATWTQTRTISRVVFIALGIILALAAIMWLLYSLEGVILLVVLAIFFAYLIAPLVDLVRRPFKVRGGAYTMPRPIAIGIVYLVIFGSLGLTLYFLAPSVAAQINDFTEKSPVYRDVIQGRTQNLQRLTQRFGLPATVQSAVVNLAPQALDTAKTYITETLPVVVLFLPWLVLIPILGFFLLKDAESFRRSALKMLPRGRMRWRGDEFFQDVNSTLAAYIRAQLTACLLIGIICTIGFFLLEVPYWLALGMVAGLFEFIPLAGPLAVMIIAGVVASFVSGSKVALVLAFLLILRVVHDYVIYPRIIGQGIHLHPLAVVLAILCGEELAGLAGIFLAIPVVAIISVTYRHWLEHRGSTGIVADMLKPVEQAALAPAIDATATPSATPQTATPPQTPTSPPTVSPATR